MNIKGSKHLTLGERIVVSELLVQNKSLNEISEAISKDSRTGRDCSLEEMALIDDTLTKGTKKGQSIQHIVAINPDKIRYSISSVYRFIKLLLTLLLNIQIFLPPK